MARLRHLLFVYAAIQTCAAYADFYFASEKSNWKCNALTFDCIPPFGCVRDGILNKTYCCGADDPDAKCSGFSTACGANNKPLTGQIPCDTGDDAFCCLEDKEACTQRTNQINVCWATALNPYANVTAQKMNETFSSLTSAHPRQTTWAIDTVALLATASSASTTDPSSESITSTSTSTSTSTQSSDSDSGLSGGAIGGIVVGVVGGLALIGIGAFFYWRRANKKAHGNEMDGTSSNPYAAGNNGYGVVAQNAPHEKYANRVSPQQQYSAPMELDTSQSLAEVEGSRPGVGMGGGGHPYR